MSSHAISGRPGGGKSAYGLKLLLRELLETERPIVTNLPLRMDNIFKYCQDQGRDDVAVYDRIQILSDEQVPAFWRFRGNLCEPLPDCQNEAWKKGERPAFDQIKGPVCYFLDEVHDFLNSRNWQTTGSACLYYISKHRHLGDDVYWITQSVKNVDSQFRSVTQDFTYVRNYAKEKFRGWTKGKYFVATTYLEPLSGVALPDPQESEKFKVEKDIFECYYTSKQKLSADTEVKQSGWSIKWVFGAIAFLAVLVIIALVFAPDLVFKYLNGKTQPLRSFPSPSSQAASRAPGFLPSTPSPTPSPTPKPLVSLAVPLVNWTASQFLNREGKNTLQIPTGLTIEPNGANNAVMLTGFDLQVLSTFAEYVKAFDVPSEIVVVRAVIGRIVKGDGLRLGLFDLFSPTVKTSLSEIFDLAVLNFSTGVASFGSVIAARQAMDALSNFEATDFHFEVLSKPVLTLVCGTYGSFATGREIPLPVTTRDSTGSSSSVQYKNAEFRFEVSPTMLGSKKCRVILKQSNSDVIGSAQVNGSSIPTLSTQSLETVIDLVPGEIIYLGGMITQGKQDDQKTFPVLGKIPVFDFLLASKKKSCDESELVLLLSVDFPNSPNEIQFSAKAKNDLTAMSRQNSAKNSRENKKNAK